MRYGEEVIAAHGGMARAAAEHGRDNGFKRLFATMRVWRNWKAISVDANLGVRCRIKTMAINYWPDFR
jgi:hypothetical protein